MRRNIDARQKAARLRQKGYSLNEIVAKLGVAKSSVSSWVRNIELGPKARQRLLTKIKLGQLISAENKREKTRQLLDFYLRQSLIDVRSIPSHKTIKKLLCALLYWCEGAKDIFSPVHFVNSDPRLVRVFLKLFREVFRPDEKKFRICVHLHDYHIASKQIAFWSKLTKISKGQFLKPYRKANTGIRIRKDYPGCVAIKYFDSRVAKQLLMMAQAFFEDYK